MVLIILLDILAKVGSEDTAHGAAAFVCVSIIAVRLKIQITDYQTVRPVGFVRRSQRNLTGRVSFYVFHFSFTCSASLIVTLLRKAT